MIRSGLVALAVLCSLVLSNHEVVAQVRGPGLQPNRQEMVRQIQQRFRDRMARELELEEGQGEVLADIFAEFGEARAALLPRRRQLATEVRELMAGDRSDSRAMELIQELRELRQRETELMIEEEDRLLETLSPSQVLRLQTLRDQFGDQIRRLGGPAGSNGTGLRGRGPGGVPRP